MAGIVEPQQFTQVVRGGRGRNGNGQPPIDLNQLMMLLLQQREGGKNREQDATLSRERIAAEQGMASENVKAQRDIAALNAGSAKDVANIQAQGMKDVQQMRNDGEIAIRTLMQTFQEKVQTGELLQSIGNRISEGVNNMDPLTTEMVAMGGLADYDGRLRAISEAGQEHYRWAAEGKTKVEAANERAISNENLRKQFNHMVDVAKTAGQAGVGLRGDAMATSTPITSVDDAWKHMSQHMTGEEKAVLNVIKDPALLMANKDVLKKLGPAFYTKFRGQVAGYAAALVNPDMAIDLASKGTAPDEIWKQVVAARDAIPEGGRLVNPNATDENFEIAKQLYASQAQMVKLLPNAGGYEELGARLEVMEGTGKGSLEGAGIDPSVITGAMVGMLDDAGLMDGVFDKIQKQTGRFMPQSERDKLLGLGKRPEVAAISRGPLDAVLEQATIAKEGLQLGLVADLQAQRPAVKNEFVDNLRRHKAGTSLLAASWEIEALNLVDPKMAQMAAKRLQAAASALGMDGYNNNPEGVTATFAAPINEANTIANSLYAKSIAERDKIDAGVEQRRAALMNDRATQLAAGQQQALQQGGQPQSKPMTASGAAPNSPAPMKMPQPQQQMGPPTSQQQRQQQMATLPSSGGGR